MDQERVNPEWKPAVAIVGPTAVGKTEVAVQVAKALGAEVVTADSRQVYRGMDIGTDKPSVEARQGVPHHLIDLVDPDERFNVGLYRRLALQTIAGLQQQGRVPLIVGGTGLYLRALLRGLWDGPAADWAFRARVTEQARRSGPGSLHKELSRVDPELASRLHPRDTVKIIRGLEVHHLTGRPLSAVHRDHGFRDGRLSPLWIGLIRDRDALYRRIEARVEAQLARGLLRETRTLLAAGYGRELASMKGLGYRHLSAYLAGELGYDEAVDLFKRDTRRFAKRQLTWFRQEPQIRWVHVQESEQTASVVQHILALGAEYLARLPRSLSGRATARPKLGSCATAG